MMRVMLWKEYREHRLVWATLALVGLGALAGVPQVVALFGASAAIRDVESTLGTAAVAVAWVYGLVCGGMLLAGERENGTQPFLDALPARRLGLWAAKFLLGVFFVIGQVALLGVGLWFVLDHPRRVGAFLAAGIPAVLFGGLYGLAWGLLVSAYCRYVLNAVFLGFVAQVAAGLLLYPFVLLVTLLFAHNEASQSRVEVVATLAAMVLLVVAPVAGSAWVFARQDLQRARSGPVMAGGKRVRQGGGWAALLWLAWRQVRRLALGLGLFSLAGACLMPFFGLLVWPAVTSVVGVLCGVTVFLDEQRLGSYRFLGEQRFPLTRVWLVKVGVHLAVLLLSLLILAAPAIATTGWSAMNDSQFQYRDRDAGLVALALKAELFNLRPGWVFVLLWPAYGFAIGHLNGLVFRKGLVAVVVALMQCWMVSTLWLPSVVVGGLHFWQVGVVPLVLLAAAWSMMRPWASDRLLSRGPLLAGVGACLLSVLWLAGGVWYRVEEIPLAPQRYDLDAFAKRLPKPEDNKAGQLLRTGLTRVHDLRQSLGKRRPAGPLFPNRVPQMEQSFDFQLQEVRQHGWPGGNPEIAGWLDDWFADAASERGWLTPLAEAADEPLGVVESPRDMDLRSSMGAGRLDVFQEAQTAAALLVARGLQRQAEGKPEVFVDHLRLGLNLTRNLRHKSAAMPYHVAHFAEEMLLGGLDRWLERLDGHPELAQKANEVLRRHEAENPTDPEEVVKAQYLVDLNGFDRLVELYSASEPASASAGPAWILRQAQLEVLRLVQQVPWERARMLRFIRLGHEGQPRPNRAHMENLPRFLWVVAGDWNLDNLGRSVTRARCQLHAAQLKLALRQYQIEKGRPAEKLSLLVPGYLPSISTDPYDGQPFRYRLSRGETIGWPEEPRPVDFAPGPAAAVPPPDDFVGPPAPDEPAGDAVPEPVPPGGPGGMIPGRPVGGPPAPGRWVPAGQGILWSVGEDRVDNGGRGQVGSNPRLTRDATGEDLIFLVPLPPLRWPVGFSP
jgi:hypothetical protein